MERIKDSPIADPTVSSSVAPVVLIQNRKGGGLAMSMVEVTVVVRECVCVSRLRSAWAMSAVASQQSITTQPNFRGEQLQKFSQRRVDNSDIRRKLTETIWIENEDSGGTLGQEE